MIFVVGAFAGVAARTGQHLSGSRIKHVFTNRVGKRPMETMALVTDIIDRAFEHVWMIRSMRCMTVAAGLSLFMLIF